MKIAVSEISSRVESLRARLESLKRETEKAGGELARVAAFFASDKETENISGDTALVDEAGFELEDCFDHFEEAIGILRAETDWLESEIRALRVLSEESIKAI